MTVSSYLFQSPYSQAVQYGRPDPVAQAQAKAQEQRANVPAAPIQEAAKQYSAASVSASSAGSINVAAVSSNSGVSDALSGFSALNAQRAASDAYSA